MRTRSAILLGTLLPLFWTCNARSTGTDASFGCLCTSDRDYWPSDATFYQLQYQVSQPLVYPRPTAYPCYPPSHPSGNCTNVNANWGDGNWRASQPGSMELANYEMFMFQNGTLDACYLDTNVTGTCGQGRVPVIGVDARSVEDIRAAIGFAVEHRLKLVVKNTGHDFIGRSAARGSFVVWTHNMKNITYDATFLPQGGPVNGTFEAVTLGAGVQWYEAYAAANEHDRMMVGGISAGGSVGASGGWLAGGGHSFLSPSYGLGVDNALEISVVLSSGEYLIMNAYQNLDLFWALRGDGPSTYGVVTSVTYLTYPMVPVQIWEYQGNVTNSSVLPELVEDYLRFQAEFTDDGWGGYGGISSQGLSFTNIAPNMTNQTVATTMQGWQNFTESLTPYGVVSSNTIGYFSSVYELLYELMFSGDAEDGGYMIVTSRLLSRDTIANKTSQVTQVLVECGAGFNTIAGGKVNQFGADSAGLNPRWRDAITEAVTGVSWNETTSSNEIREQIQQLKGCIQAMYNVTPDDGAYLNEASPFEVDWQGAFFGEHCSTLKSIKNKYDPYRLFVVAEGVGSEDWDKI